MIIYMKHPQHGTKVAIAEDEAIEDEKNGWVRYEVAAILKPIPNFQPENNEFLESSPVTEVINEDDISILRDKWKEKYGKLPHHRKGIETLKAELT